jgi:hypothetical protein
MKKTVILLILLLNTLQMFSQNAIVLTHKKTNRIIHFSENRRIKIVTKNNNRLVGNFTVVDSNTIKIANKWILISEIKKIKAKSEFSSIITPTATALGGTFLLGAVIGAFDDGLATVILGPPGLILFLIPMSENNHPISRWEYKIQKTEKVVLPTSP